MRNIPGFNIGGGSFDIDFVIRGPDLDALSRYARGAAHAGHRARAASPTPTPRSGSTGRSLRVQIDRERAGDSNIVVYWFGWRLVRTPTSSPASGTATALGTFRGIRKGATDYGATVFGVKGIAPTGGFGGYKPLVVEIAKFFKTGKPPVTPEETLEIIAFMEAAEESKRQGGKPVTIESVMAKAPEAAAAAASALRKSAPRTPAGAFLDPGVGAYSGAT